VRIRLPLSVAPPRDSSVFPPRRRSPRRPGGGVVSPLSSFYRLFFLPTTRSDTNGFNFVASLLNHRSQTNKIQISRQILFQIFVTRNGHKLHGTAKLSHCSNVNWWPEDGQVRLGRRPESDWPHRGPGSRLSVSRNLRPGPGASGGPSSSSFDSLMKRSSARER